MKKEKELIKIANQLRKRSTEAEKIPWNHLSNKQMEGFKFRRQQIVGRYILDFVCFEKKLAIEVDGGQHDTEKEKDCKRDHWLNSQGFEVLRFWNCDVFDSLEAVLEVVRHKLLSPSPCPSHQGRGD